MEQRSGKSICKGIAFGEILFLEKREKCIEKRTVGDVEAECGRYEDARKEAIWQQKGFCEQAEKRFSEKELEIFRAHLLLLKDEEYTRYVKNVILSQSVNAEYAVQQAGDHFAELFSVMEDDYWKARGMDVLDVTAHLLDVMCKEETLKRQRESQKEGSVILLAEHLAPADLLHLDKKRIKGVITQNDAQNSHTAILLRSMEIPSVTGIEIEEAWQGKWCVLDGNAGVLCIEPDQNTLDEYGKRAAEIEGRKRSLTEVKGKEIRSKSGKKMEILANIGSLEDLEAVLRNGAEGIGLFRSEFLYLKEDDFPSEEEQFQIYKEAAEAMGGKRVVIRTLDAGSDKQAAYMGFEKEENPALGFRGIRVSLAHPEGLRTQLRAIFRAGAHGNVAVLYPMITSKEEVTKVREISEAVRKELDQEGTLRGEVQEGIMIETPAAALMSSELAELVDFFSIGTNDLTQYTLGMDRQNVKLEGLYDTHHPAVLRLIGMITENAHKAGIPCGICGELAADDMLTETFLDMGVDSLSVSAGFILSLRKKILECE